MRNSWVDSILLNSAVCWKYWNWFEPPKIEAGDGLLRLLSMQKPNKVDSYFSVDVIMTKKNLDMLTLEGTGVPATRTTFAGYAVYR